MARYATTIRLTNADGSVEVDLSGCRGYIDGKTQFGDDTFRETQITSADGTPRFQSLWMGPMNLHRGNMLGITFDAAIAAAKVTALKALGAGVKAAGSHIKAYLVDATINLNGQKCRPDPKVDFWIVEGRESEGMIDEVRIFLVAI